MDLKPTRIPYDRTGLFSTIALDYVAQAPALSSFFSFPPSYAGVEAAIEKRKSYPTDRALLVDALRRQYAHITPVDNVTKNIESLLDAATFTITTAHQNNIFTGPLYFIYKIVHAIRMADDLNAKMPQYRFVPVYYMGSEDADLAELDHISIQGEQLQWKTAQRGAVGRMKIDKALVSLIDRMEGELTVLPHGRDIIDLFRKHYREGVLVQEATFSFVHELFAEYGLVVLLPDDAKLKSSMRSVFRDDLLNETAARIVGETATRLEQAGHKVQAHPREINLFYLKDDIRERIRKSDNGFMVLTSDKQSLPFSEADMLTELEEHPERFSPNVILRGLYQETILPNVAFIGGGGELAYWLQLKDLFENYDVPFPVLVLRNSFLVVTKKWRERMKNLPVTMEEIFLPTEALLGRLVIQEKNDAVHLNGSLEKVQELYAQMREKASAIDTTLAGHVDALKAGVLHRLQELEKKMIRAEKRKYTTQRRQIETLKQALFPGNGLQERVENIAWFYAAWGPSFIRTLYIHCLPFTQEFTVLAEE